MSTEVTFRAARAEDLPSVAEVFLAAREAAVPAMPPIVHSPQDVRDHVLAFDLAERDLWLADIGDRVAAYAELKGDWLDDLYVHPAHQGSGLGSALLDLAKSLRPDGFCLWVFESNAPARAFYTHRSLIELERTDGSGNEERAPDVKMAWPGQDPLAFYRRLIDDVDATLAELLARRAGLTRVVQRHKHEPSRDPDRERQIAEAMAAVAPELGVERLSRIMHLVIGELLDAAQESRGQSRPS
jgi:GNAT superfamily N-acetyltransferase